MMSNEALKVNMRGMEHISKRIEDGWMTRVDFLLACLRISFTSVVVCCKLNHAKSRQVFQIRHLQTMVGGGEPRFGPKLAQESRLVVNHHQDGERM